MEGDQQLQPLYRRDILVPKEDLTHYGRVRETCDFLMFLLLPWSWRQRWLSTLAPKTFLNKGSPPH